MGIKELSLGNPAFRERFHRYSIANLALRASSMLLRKGADSMLSLANYIDVPRFGLSGHGRSLLARNAALRNQHCGKRCFVIGNGPSLAEQNLESLRGEIVFAVNSFWQHPVIDCWRPNYYCLSDPVFYEDTPDTARYFDSLTDRIPDAKFFIPVGWADRFERLGRLPAGQTYHFDFLTANRRPSSLDLTRPIPAVGTIVPVAILIAIEMGCSPIYLTGLDHDWLTLRDSSAYQNFHPSYAGVNTTEHFTYKQRMENVLWLWGYYEWLKAIAEARGVCIVNVTAGGFLDVFECARYEDVVRPVDSPREMCPASTASAPRSQA